MESEALSKSQWRKVIAGRIAAFSAEEISGKSHRIIRRLEELEAFTQARRILLYASLPDEVRTDELLIDIWRDKTKTALLPRVCGKEGGLQIYEVCTASELLTGAYGVREPIPEVCSVVDPGRVDCVLVPGRGVDERGDRLGRGKGYYDRFLDRLAPEVPRIGLFFECQRVGLLPIQDHDHRLNFAVTEERVYEFACQK